MLTCTLAINLVYKSHNIIIIIVYSMTCHNKFFIISKNIKKVDDYDLYGTVVGPYRAEIDDVKPCLHLLNLH